MQKNKLLKNKHFKELLSLSSRDHETRENFDCICEF